MLFDDTFNQTDHVAVWQANDSSLAFYIEDSNGNVAITGTPDITIPFIENVSVNGACLLQRIPVTGRPAKRLRRLEPYEYACSIESLYLDKKIELRLSDIFQNSAWLRIVFALANVRYADPDNDYHVLKHVSSSKFTVLSRDNERVHISAEFEAEDFCVGLTNW